MATIHIDLSHKRAYPDPGRDPTAIIRKRIPLHVQAKHVLLRGFPLIQQRPRSDEGVDRPGIGRISIVQESGEPRDVTGLMGTGT